MGRIYRPESKPEKTSSSDTVGTPGGRMYRPSSGVAVSEDGPQPPAASANKKEWSAYAKKQGATDSELRSLTRDAIAEKYGSQPEAPAEPPADPAASTVQEDPIKAAKDTAVATGAVEPPEGAEDVVTDPAAETQQEDPIGAAVETGGPAGVNQPKSNASREAWATFAQSQGATDEDLEGLGRNDIRDRYSSDLI